MSDIDVTQAIIKGMRRKQLGELRKLALEKAVTVSFDSMNGVSAPASEIVDTARTFLHFLEGDEEKTDDDG